MIYRMSFSSSRNDIRRHRAGKHDLQINLMVAMGVMPKRVPAMSEYRLAVITHMEIQ